MNSRCAICRQNNDQLLMLTCSHDPCIECASLHYIKELKMQADFQLSRNFHNVYPCEICFEVTKIDPSSIEEIKAFSNNKNMEKTHDRNKRRCKSNSHKGDIIKSRFMKETKAKKSSSKRVQSPPSSTSSSRHF